jgi:hypothetical protein
MLPLFLIIPAIVLWWAFVLNLVGLMSGWWTLARHYRTRSPFEGTRFRLCSGRLGLSNYGSSLVIGVNADGLYLSVFFFFRPGHPPLFIPWSEIVATSAKGWLFQYLDLRFQQAPDLRLRISHALGLRIADAANRSWGGDEPQPNEPEA